MTRLPKQKYYGTTGEVQLRNQERARIMEERYGVKFSYCGDNPLGVKHSRKLGIPGAGLPKAIYNHKIDPVDDHEKITAVLNAWKEWKSFAGYVTFTTLAFATKLSFEDVFGVVRHLFNLNPHGISLSVNRLGHCTIVKIDRKYAKELMSDA